MLWNCAQSIQHSNSKNCLDVLELMYYYILSLCACSVGDYRVNMKSWVN